MKKRFCTIQSACAASLLVAVLVFFTACSRSVHGKEQEEICRDELEQIGEVNYFMGIGEGKSIDSQMAKKIARTEARNDLAEKMNTFVREDITTHQSQGGDPTSYQTGWDNKGRQIVSQKLQGLSTFCTKTYKNDAGLYTSFIGVRLDIEKKVFLNQVRQELGI